MALNQDNQPLRFRVRVLQIVLCSVVFLLVAKVWQLSVLDYYRYELLAQNNRIRRVALVAPRGLILDRNGNVLVDNTDALRLLLYQDDVLDWDDTLRFLADGLGEEPAELEGQIREKANRLGPFRPIEVRSVLTHDEVAFFKARQTDHPEMRIELRPLRIYRHDDLAAHVLGYVGEIDQRQLEDPRFEKHSPGDLVGKFGVEFSRDQLLTGVDGELRLRVNSRGKMIDEVGRREPKQGQTVQLTIDIELQKVAEEALGKDAGAAVAINPRSGEILVMASRPSFDPNAFALRISSKEWETLNRPDTPLRNRAIQSAFSPGSTFKPIMAATGLETGVGTLDKKVFCPGYAAHYGHVFRCHLSGGHGWVGLRQAIERSCNVYFYELGRNLSIDQIHRFATLFGLGEATGVDLPGEVSGLMPSSAWKRRARNQPWYPGETISVSIGQGPINATPLQMARAVSTLATGRKPSIRILLEPNSDSGATAPILQLAEKNVEAIRDGMWLAVNHQGTAWRARVGGFDVCGKTGTAQLIGRETKEKLSGDKAKSFEDNAWFVGFAPRDDPEIAVVVIVQRGGGGGAAAAPIAGKIFQHYFDTRHKTQGDSQKVEAGPVT